MLVTIVTGCRRGSTGILPSQSLKGAGPNIMGPGRPKYHPHSGLRYLAIIRGPVARMLDACLSDTM